MLSFFSTLFLGVIAAFVGAYLQRKLWRHKTIEEIRQRETTEAKQLVSSIARSLDRRLNEHRYFMSRIQRKVADKNDYEKYLSESRIWMESYSTYKTGIYHLFGKSAMLEFENNIAGELIMNGRIVVRAFNIEYNRLNERDRKEQDEVFTRMSFISYLGAKYINHLNERIANNEIGQISQHNNINSNTLEMLDTSYLILRLFGIKS